MTTKGRIGCAAVALALVGVAVVLYAVLDAATASFFLFALALVCGLGAAPVVFGVVTRGRDERYNRELEEREEERGGRG